MKKLSRKQLKVIEAIQYYQDEYGFSPTIREICDLTNIKFPSSVFNMIQILEDKGYLSSVCGKARTYKILKKVDE